jgi:hypothetical protein
MFDPNDWKDIHLLDMCSKGWSIDGLLKAVSVGESSMDTKG